MLFNLSISERVKEVVPGRFSYTYEALAQNKEARVRSLLSLYALAPEADQFLVKHNLGTLRQGDNEKEIRKYKRDYNRNKRVIDVERRREYKKENKDND